MIRIVRKSLIATTTIIIGLASLGCSSELGKESQGFFSKLVNPSSYKIYRMEINQGNVLEAETVAKIKPGMTKEQVSYLLGSPILPTVFHDDRWDYIYYKDNTGKERQLYRLVLLFDGNRIINLRKTKNLIVKELKTNKTKKNET